MESGISCRERERLLRRFSDAVTSHNETVSKMAELAGCNQTDAFAMAKKQVTQTKRAVHNAKQELEAHIREHGC